MAKRASEIGVYFPISLVPSFCQKEKIIYIKGTVLKSEGYCMEPIPAGGGQTDMKGEASSLMWSPQTFQQELLVFLRSDQARYILAEYILNGEMLDFLAGGCRIFAEGFQFWMNASPATFAQWGIERPSSASFPSPVKSQLATITSRWYHPKHVVVAVEGLYLDAAGIHTGKQLLEIWKQYQPRIVGYSPRRLTRYRIIADPEASRELAYQLAQYFGHFDHQRVMNDEMRPL